jgi:hypothetical protein
MSDREKVVEALKICATGTNPCDKCPMKDRCKGVSNAAMAAAIELLMPVEPGQDAGGIWHCGGCGAPLFAGAKYCYRCGKAVKWDV